jgi:hypothetical protein
LQIGLIPLPSGCHQHARGSEYGQAGEHKMSNKSMVLLLLYLQKGQFQR